MTSKRLPIPADTLRKEYRQLIADIDTEMGKLISTHFQNVLKCGPGCSDCCIAFTVLPLEAAFIAEKLEKSNLVKRTDLAKCVMLSEDMCQVYTVRPVICRTQGLPLGYVDELAGTIEVSACQLNFPDDFPLTQENLFFMNQFNLRLADLNTEYCKMASIEVGKRIPLADLVL